MIINKIILLVIINKLFVGFNTDDDTDDDNIGDTDDDNIGDSDDTDDTDDNIGDSDDDTDDTDDIDDINDTDDIGAAVVILTKSKLSNLLPFSKI